MKGPISTGLVAATAATLLLAAIGRAPAAPPSFSPPQQLGFAPGDDWEPSIAADRFGHVYASGTTHARHGRPRPSCPECPSPHMELQISSDGGRTWSEPRALLPDATERQDDPQIVVDPVDGRTVYTAFMMGDKASMFVAKSTDFGETWEPVLVENLRRGTDKCILAVRGRRRVPCIQRRHEDLRIGFARWRSYVDLRDHRLQHELEAWLVPSVRRCHRLARGTRYFAWGGLRSEREAIG